MKKSVFTIIICVCMALVLTVGCSHLSGDIKEQPKNPQFILANDSSEDFHTFTNSWGEYSIECIRSDEVYINLIDIDSSNVVVKKSYGNISFEIMSNSQIKVNTPQLGSRIILKDTVSGVTVEITTPSSISKVP